MADIKKMYQKFLQGQTTQEETASLLRFFEDSTPSDTILDLIELELEKEPQGDLTGEDFQFIQETKILLKDQLVRPSSIRKFSLAAWISVAASILLLGAGIWIYYGLSSSDESSTASTLVDSGIQPGRNKATLILSDGQKMELSAEQHGIKVSEDGIRYLNGTPLTVISERRNVTLSVPKAGQYQLTLGDGTKVWLNADSRLDYPLQFEGNRRVVRLEGEGYFEVRHDKNKPFIVQFNGNEVEVLGTSFNVQAYPGMKDNRTTLVEGSVRIRNEEKISQVLKPNQQGVISAKEIKVRPVNVEQYTLWKDGIFVWDKQEIRSIIPQLERWYDITFDLSGIPIDTPTLSGEIPRDITLQAVLDVLENQLKLKFEVRGRRVMVKN